jgi:hypothetical protein
MVFVCFFVVVMDINHQFGQGRSSGRSSRPLPQNRLTNHSDDMEAARLPAGKVDTIRLLQLLRHQKKPQKQWFVSMLRCFNNYSWKIRVIVAVFVGTLLLN